jgi:hypothetical protein
MIYYCTLPSVDGPYYTVKWQPPNLKDTDTLECLPRLGDKPRTTRVVPIGMALEYMPSELDDRHPGASRHLYGSNNLHVSLGNILHSDSPIGVTHIAIPHALLKKEKNLE